MGEPTLKTNVASEAREIAIFAGHSGLPAKGYRSVVIKPPPSRLDPGRRLYFLQNLKYFFRALRAGCYNFYKTSKFSSALRAGGYIFYKILNFFRASRGEVIFFTKSAAKINRFLNVFWTVSALITAKNPKKFRALRAHGFGGPKKFPALRAGGFILYKIPKIFSALRAGGFILYKIPIFFLPRFAREVLFFTKSQNFVSGRFHVGGGFNSISPVVVSLLRSMYSIV